jgi:hypothetical protein
MKHTLWKIGLQGAELHLRESADGRFGKSGYKGLSFICGSLPMVDLENRATGG